MAGMSKRKYKTGPDREQLSLLPASIDDYVSEGAVVRAIDVYVDTLDLAELGFAYADGGNVDGKGQPPYAPADLLKLYLYGYLHKVRSSRMLERETHLNLEVIWLLGRLTPSFKTIADFRRDNASALKETNKDFVRLCKDLDLLGGKTNAIDGSFFHANASKASIYKKAGLDKELARLEEQIERYRKELDENDKKDEATGKTALAEDPELAAKLAALKKKQSEKQELKKKLEESGESQISTTDEDARLLNKGHGTIAGYNVQSVVDDKHKLIVASDVTNDGNDQNQLHRMALMAMETLGVEELEALADAGYFNAADLAKCERDGVVTFVPEPRKSARLEKEGRFTRAAFSYDGERNIYKCPGGEELAQQGEAHKKNGVMRRRYSSRASQCKGCALRSECLPQKGATRSVYRSEHEDVVERQRARMLAAKGKMRERSGLVEHPFGTLKLRAGWMHFLVRGFEKVGGEWALMATCYNFTRVLNIIGFDAFRDYCVQRRKKREENSLLALFALFCSPAKPILTFFPGHMTPSGRL